jgi:hypothetical protein
MPWSYFESYKKVAYVGEIFSDRFQAYAGVQLSSLFWVLGQHKLVTNVLGQHISTIFIDQDSPVGSVRWQQDSRCQGAINKKPTYAVQQCRKGKILDKCYLCWLELQRFGLVVASTNQEPINIKISHQYCSNNALDSYHEKSLCLLCWPAVIPTRATVLSCCFLCQNAMHDIHTLHGSMCHKDNRMWKKS